MTRFDVRHRTCALVLVAMSAVARVAQGQASVTIAAGNATSVQVAPGGFLTVPIVVDMSLASGGSLATFAGGLTWNIARLVLDSITSTGFGTLTTSLSNAAAGSITLAVANGTGTTTTLPVANAYFTATPSQGGTRVQMAVTAASNEIGALSLRQMLTRSLDVCVATFGRWGDANADATVNIIDAQQIARSVVGLSVANSVAVLEQGDVTADGVVNIIDAQQIARYTIALSAPARVNTGIFVQPAVASVVVNRSAVTSSVNQTVTLTATPKDAAGNAMPGCPVVTWSSSDATKAAVNAGGVVRMIAPGVATITATSAGQTATVPVTVTGPDVASTLLKLRSLTAGGTAATESAWMFGGMLTDEWKSSDSFTQRNGADQRLVLDNDTFARTMLGNFFALRSDAQGTASALITSSAAGSAIGQMYFVTGYAELLMAEMFCNGLWFNDATSGLVVSGPAISNAAVYTRAIAHFDTAMVYALGGADTASVTLQYVTRVAKARALVQTGQFAAASALVAPVPTSFQHLSTVSSALAENNKIWSFNNSQKRYSVGDSVDVAGMIGNAIPFKSANDSRVPTTTSGVGFDFVTSSVQQNVFSQTTVVPLLSGLDARLIEAEAKLNAGDLAGMTALLNSLRTSPQNLGGISSSFMPPLPAPANQSAAVSVFFREKAFWTFGRGQRLGDLRRLVRLYGRVESAVYPTGAFFKGGVYGSSIFFPVMADEDNGVVSPVCIDRNP